MKIQVQMENLVSNIPINHQNFIDHAVPLLSADTRILGIAAAGSLINGTMDVYSDLDLVVVSNDDAYPSIMSERQNIVERLGNLLVAFSGEHVGEPRLLICLYDSPLIHVDIKFVSMNDFSNRIENPVILWERDFNLSTVISKSHPNHPMPNMQWIEDRFWVWIHYVSLKIGRGELFETIDFISFLRQRVFGPMSSVIQNQLPRGVRRIETVSPKYIAAFKKTIAVHDRKSCVEATRAAIDLYILLRKDVADSTVIQRTAAQEAAIRYFNEII